MIVPDVIFWTSMIAWLVFWLFIGNITRKIGILVVPLTLVFGGYIFVMKLDDVDESDSLGSMPASMGWKEIGLAVLIIVFVWLAKWWLEKVTGER
ncbi:hypothetical protein ACRWP7_003335 [Escherichia coli]